jgi:hypothetical protein
MAKEGRRLFTIRLPRFNNGVNTVPNIGTGVSPTYETIMGEGISMDGTTNRGIEITIKIGIIELKNFV